LRSGLLPYPDFVCHYYDASTGPFLNLSDLPLEEAERVLDRIRRVGAGFASKRSLDYLRIRRGLEDEVRTLFVEKGGKPRRERPHYMILGSCPWIKGWYREGRELRIPLARFRPELVSFTYGDTFPAMRFRDGRPYRGQVYVLDELPDLSSPTVCPKSGIAIALAGQSDTSRPRSGTMNPSGSFW
jgi:hypothetical protein